jgi:hypothetical protein
MQVAAMVAMLPDDDEQLRADMLEGETDLYEMLSKILGWAEEDEGAIIALDAQMADRAERKKRAADRIANRRQMIAALMDIARLDKIVLPEATLSKRLGKPKLIVADDEAVPDEYQVTKKTPDKKAINEAFEDVPDLPNWLVREDGRDVLTVRRK